MPPPQIRREPLARWRCSGSNTAATLRISQSQLAAGRLRYRHNGNDGPGELADSFSFTPFDRFDTAGAPVTVPLTIAPLNDPPVASQNAPLTLVEGSRGVIKGSNGVARRHVVLHRVGVRGALRQTRAL